MFTPPINLSPTAEKAREILKEVKEAQETFKKQRETIKLEAEVRMYTFYLVTVEQHPSTAYTYDITLKVLTVLPFTLILQQPLNRIKPHLLYRQNITRWDIV